MNEKGDFVGEVCHIEAALEDGERFNPDMTNEERRAFDNLMLMCHDHHVETDNVDDFPVERMVEMKREHERRFSSPDRAILEHLTDWTTADEPTTVANLRSFNEVLDFNLSEEELDEMIDELNDHIERISRVPIDVRRFLGAVVRRIHKMGDTPAVCIGTAGADILVSDFRLAHRLGDRAIREKIAELESYGVGGLDHINSDVGMNPAIRIGALSSGWNVWVDIVAFSEQAQIPLEGFTEDLDFSPLDG